MRRWLFGGEMIPEVLMAVKIFLILKMAENGIKTQPVPNHVGLSRGRHELSAVWKNIYAFWVLPCACQEACEKEFLMTHKFAVHSGISAYLNYKHGLYRRCGKPCKATKGEKFDPCSSITQSKVGSEVLLKVQDCVSVFCCFPHFSICRSLMMLCLAGHYNDSSGKICNLPLTYLSEKSL